MMKTKILSFMFLMGIVLIGTNAFAQPTTTSSSTSDSNADVGSSKTYTLSTATGSHTWTWALRADGGNSGSNPSFSASSTNAQTVDWSGTTSGDIFYLDVYYADGTTGCYSEMLTYKITITEGTLQFTGGGSANDAIVCSDLTGPVEGGDTSDETSDQVIQSVTFDGTDNLTNVTYTITAPTGTAGATEYYNGSLGSPSSTLVTLTTTDVSAKVATITTDIDFLNDTGSDVVFTVTITGGLTSTGATPSAGTESTSTITVKAIPSIAF